MHKAIGQNYAQLPQQIKYNMPSTPTIQFKNQSIAEITNKIYQA